MSQVKSRGAARAGRRLLAAASTTAVVVGIAVTPATAAKVRCHSSSQHYPKVTAKNTTCRVAKKVISAFDRGNLSPRGFTCFTMEGQVDGPVTCTKGRKKVIGRS